MFRDRIDAGKQLLPLLESYKNRTDTIVIGLPRGGVVVAFEIAKGLSLPLDVICPMKVGSPFNPEYAIGAVTETGEGVFNYDEIGHSRISESYLNAAISKLSAEALNRLKLFRDGRKPLYLDGKNVILVDDGIATGLTMKAAIQSLRKSNAGWIVVAVPAGPASTLEELQSLADEVVCVEIPPYFFAVSQVYQEFNQTSTDEVVKLLKDSEHFSKQ